MKTLLQIIEDCKDGKIPDINDARFAICALDALSTFDASSIRRFAEMEKGHALMEYNEHFRRWKTALGNPPIEWLGESNNPDNPVYQQRRRMARKIFDKVSSQPTG